MVGVMGRGGAGGVNLPPVLEEGGVVIQSPEVCSVLCGSIPEGSAGLAPVECSLALQLAVCALNLVSDVFHLALPPFG